MIVKLDQSTIRHIGEIMIKDIRKFGYQRDIQRVLLEANRKKPSLQLYKKIKAIVVKILCNVKQFDHNTHLITENIFIQTTYYKTLTSRP